MPTISSGISKLSRSRPARLGLKLALMLLPTRIVRPLANAMGHAIAPGARIGLSWLACERLIMAEQARVGHLNLVRNHRLVMYSGARLRHMNICYGPFSMRLGVDADFGNRNTVSRAPHGVTFGSAQLWMGQGAKVTAGHSLDCTRTIRIGHYSTLAGKNSQIWTHGYVHDDEGPGRYRVDGSVRIGKNVYLGSSVIVTGGVSICDAASVGAGTCVTKHLTEPAFYVSGAMRILPKPASPANRTDMDRVTVSELTETVYWKRDAHP